MVVRARRKHEHAQVGPAVAKAGEQVFGERSHPVEIEEERVGLRVAKSGEELRGAADAPDHMQTSLAGQAVLQTFGEKRVLRGEQD